MTVRYLFTSPTTRIASAIAARWRCRPIRSPTVSNPARTAASTASSTGSRAPRRRDLAEALRDHRGGAVDQVAPAGDQLGVGALHELGPREVRVRGLRAGRADEVAQRVGLVARRACRGRRSRGRATGGELLALHREVLAGDHLGRQVEHAVLPGLAAAAPSPLYASSSAGQIWRVEDDVVLAHEVVGQGLRVVPPLAPALGVVRCAGPTRCEADR